jgi:diadenosine tetraphosphate (Ap4A) HIT family hydrolase
MEERRMPQYPTAPVDVTEYEHRIQRDNQDGRCFVCDIANERHKPGELVVYRDDVCVIFLPVPQRLYGYMLLAPVEHRTRVIEDFREDQYLALQLRIHRLGRALSQHVPTERLYVFSFGSNQGVAHVHWHLAPLPPGVPFEQQQFAAVTRAEQLVIPAHDQAALAEKINQSMSN